MKTTSGTAKWTDIRKNNKKVKEKRHKEKERNKNEFSYSTICRTKIRVILVTILGS